MNGIRARRSKFIPYDEQQKVLAIDYCSAHVDQPGFTKQFFDDYIGYCVFAQKDFEEGAFLLEYSGRCMSALEGEELEKLHGNSNQFLYFFEHEKKQFCVDGYGSSQFGPYINDSPFANCKIKKIVCPGNDVRLCFFATSYICTGRELRYNYNDKNLSWRKDKKYRLPFNLTDLTGQQWQHKKPCPKASNIMSVLNASFERESKELAMINNNLQKDADSIVRNVSDSDNVTAIAKDVKLPCLIPSEVVEVKSHVTIENDATMISNVNSNQVDSEVMDVVNNLCDVVMQNDEADQDTNCIDLTITTNDLKNGDVAFRREVSESSNVDMSDDVMIAEPKSREEIRNLSKLEVGGMAKCIKNNLSDILQGKVHSKRHQMFKEGGKSKASLRETKSGPFTDKQVEEVLSSLIEIFCKKSSKLFDYVMKVLLPDALAIIYAQLRCVTIEEAEKELDQESDIESDESDDLCVDPSTKVVDNDDDSKVSPKKKKVQGGCKRWRCPVCETEFADLPRHMRLVHKWDKEKASKVNILYGNRKTYEWQFGVPVRNVKNPNSKKNKDYHYQRCCPVTGCKAVVKRLPPHLSKVHNLKTTDEDYLHYLKTARRFVPSVERKCIAECKSAEKRRCEVKKWYKKAGVLVNFGNANNDTYLPSTKRDADIINVNTDAQPEDVFNAKELTTDVRSVSNDEIIGNYVKYLVSVDGGRLSNRKTAPQYGQMVRNVLGVVGGDDMDLSNICSRKKIRETFLSNYCVKMNFAPKTIKKYLTSLIHFYGYLIDEEINVIGYATDDLNRMKMRCHNWSKGYNNDAKQHEQLKYETDLEAIITPDQVKIYETSSIAQEAKRLLSCFSCKPFPELTRSDYCTMRNHLLVEIELQNSHRSGVTANMEVQEFQIHSFEEGLYRIKVKNHKTNRDYGPAKVYFMPELFRLMKTFVNNIRPMLVNHHQYKNVFLSFAAAPMASGAISKQIDTFWRRSGVYENVQNAPKQNITTTVFRKSISTAVLEKNPDSAGDVAQLLAHSQKTQSRYYNVRNMERSCAKGAKCITELLQRQSPRKEWTKEEICTLKSVFAEELETGSISIVRVREKINELKDIDGVSVRKVFDKLRSLIKFGESSVTVSDLNSEKSTVELFDESFPTLPSDVASDAQHSCRHSDQSSCTEKSDFELLPKLPSLAEEFSPEKLPKETSAVKLQRIGINVEDEDSNDLDFDPVSRAQLTNPCAKKFSSQDAAKIKLWFNSMINYGPVSRSEIRNLLAETSEKKEFLDRFGIMAIQNRIKYERRQMLNKAV